MAEQLLQNFLEEIDIVKEEKTLEDLRIKYLGKKGLIAAQMSQLAKLDIEAKKKFGAEINKVKSQITEKITLKKEEITNAAISSKLAKEWVDISLPGAQAPYLGSLNKYGRIHPITKVVSEIRQILNHMGFEFADGPEIEDDWHNFEALNVPPLHPARQMQDTFYLKPLQQDNESSDIENQQRLLLRTHTSNVQIRYMKKHKPPFRIFSIGKVYRSDYDATHTPMFHQVEGLVIDEKSNLTHLKSCLEDFLASFFEVKKAPVRFRPSYFPFTEPSYEVDVVCDKSNKDQLIIGGDGSDWMEVLGCGMVHENVLKSVGIDSTKYQGFAFGMGIERLAMLKYNIPDLRSFYHGDLRWLEHFGLKST